MSPTSSSNKTTHTLPHTYSELISEQKRSTVHLSYGKSSGKAGKNTQKILNPRHHLQN
ncbi:unnamed protein product [Nesidiocoris tenuis]|uniref:Uncharacterized protein n=1 Tax=Nesidiocoris tenuis TaxID=355587 RepID=A0A6H5G611_9HEMI|nr:unnamed protein product [Nesidiocoris tenuis]